MFKHPNYYKKLRASRREKAISPNDASTDEQGRTPKAASDKPQAEASSKATSHKPQAKASSLKPKRLA